MSDPKSRAAEDATIVSEGSGTVEKGSAAQRSPAATPGASLPPTGSAEAPPQCLAGRYELQGLLGVGGMGAVYRAKDVELDEIVALKMLRRELMDDPTTLARFRQEVKLARRVTHKNVARTFDIGEHEGAKFLTMEFVDGESLGVVLARRKLLPLAEVIPLCVSICAGLAAAHAAGIVHRDLKPDNVLIAKDGRVVITDFGIARAAIDVGGGVKTQGVPIGTPAYMAPEQVEGAANLDARVDIYALGAILFELLTGQRAWGGESPYSVAAARLFSAPPDPRAVNKDIPDAVANLTRKCMARNRDDRFANVQEVSAVLVSTTMPMASAPTPSVSAKSSLNAPAAGTDPGVKTVAVLPFRNAGSAEDEYLADGLTEDLIDSLSMAKGLKVRSRGAVIGYKAADRDPRDIGRELGVQVVVDGSLRRAGEMLRVSARVISVVDGFQLWAKRFDRPRADVLAVGDETARAVAEALTCSVVSAARDAPTDPAAIDLYLRARHEYHKLWEDSTQRAIDLFVQALARAPNDAMILSGYAMALMRRFVFAESASNDAELANDAAERALAASPQLGEAHLALAIVRFSTGDGSGAAREVRKALANAPSLADAHELYGRLLTEAGAVREGIMHLKSAATLDPRLVNARLDRARAAALVGDWAESDALLGEEPEDRSTQATYWVHRARMALWRRDAKRAEAALAVTRTIPLPGPAVILFTLAASGKIDGATRAAIDLRTSPGSRALRRRAFFGQIKTEVLAFLDERDAAFAALAEADDARLFDVGWMDLCPLLVELRADPRFVAMRARVGARATAVLDALNVSPTRP